MFERDNTGWSLMELQDLQVLDKPNLMSAGLTNPIHPVLARDRWFTDPSIYAPAFMADGRPWDVKYNDVWEALTPALRLASRFLAEVNVETWCVVSLLPWL